MDILRQVTSENYLFNFDFIYNHIKNVSAINKQRLTTLYLNSLIADKLDGDFAECGVWGGGSAYLLLASSSKHLHLFDSFEGLPEPQLCDYPTNKNMPPASAGWFGIPSGKLDQQVRNFLSDYSPRFSMYKGWFSDTLRTSPDLQYAMVHLDVDFYQSYKECLEYFVPRIVPGGIVVCDEYDFNHLPGAKKAIDEYFGDVESLEHWHTNIQLTIRL